MDAYLLNIIKMSVSVCVCAPVTELFHYTAASPFSGSRPRQT